MDANQVGGQRIPRALLEDAKKTLARIRAELGPFGTALTPEERRRRARFRPGAGVISLRICALADRAGVVLPAKTRDVREDLALIVQLEPLEELVEALMQVLQDTQLQAEHEAWSTATAYYTALLRIAESSPIVEARIKPMVEFFAAQGRSR